MRGLYERYLADNRERLIEGLTSGTLCSDTQVCKR